MGMDAKSFRIARAELGISQAEFARIIGVRAATVTGWINANEFPLIVRLFCRVAIDHGLDYAKEKVKP